jgi:predicted RND superfamily exporter protein
MRRAFLKLIATVTYGAPCVVLCGVAILTICAIVALLSLNIETNMVALLPEDSPVAITFRTALRDFGAFDYMLAVVESSKPHQETALIRAAEMFAGAIDDTEYIATVDYKLDPEAKDFYLQNADERIVSLLTNSDWDKITEQLQPDEMHRQLLRLKYRLLTPTTPKVRENLLADPLNISSIIRQRLVYSRGPTKLNLRQGYFLSSDGQMLLMVLKPRKPSSDLVFVTKLMTFLTRTRDTIQKRLVSAESTSSNAGRIRISFVGSHPEALNDARIIRKDLFNTLTTSFICVLGFFILVFRRLDAIYFVGLPLIIGILWTLGLTSVCIGRLTIVTFAFGAVLIGLGIDFAIHIYNRFIEELKISEDSFVALKTAIVETGEGIFTGAITTAVAFYGLLLASFKGFQELGFVAGSGILCCLLSIYLVLPSLMTIRARHAREKLIHAPLTSFGLRQVARVVFTYPRSTIALGLIITAYLAFQALSVPFNEDFRALRQPSPGYLRLRDRLERRFDLPSNQVIAIVSGKTIQEALEKNDALYDNIEQAHSTYDILSCDSLRTFLPSIKTQERSQQLILSLDINALEQSLVSEGRKLGFAPETFQPFLERLRLLQQHARQENLVEFGSVNSPIFKRLVWKYMHRTPKGYRIVTHIYPASGTWQRAVPTEFLNSLEKGVDHVDFTGVAIIAKELEKVVKKDLAHVVIIVTLSVLLILLLHFRSVFRAVLSLIPVLCGSLWMLGSMHILGIQMNFLNIIVAPMIIGIGVDNGIHLLQRYYSMSPQHGEPGNKQQNADALSITIENTGRAIVITSCTTILGFGSLAFASFRGIREMGILSILGVGFCLIAALTILPAVLKIWEPRKRLADLIGTEQEEIR